MNVKYINAIKLNQLDFNLRTYNVDHEIRTLRKQLSTHLRSNQNVCRETNHKFQEAISNWDIENSSHAKEGKN